MIAMDKSIEMKAVQNSEQVKLCDVDTLGKSNTVNDLHSSVVSRQDVIVSNWL